MSTADGNRITTRDGKRFTTGDHPDIEEISDPHTTDDETEPLKDRLYEHRWFLAIGLPIGLAAFAVLIGYTWHIVPEILGNVYVQVGSLFMIAIGLTAFLTDRRRQNIYEQYDWLVLRTAKGPQRFLGYLKQAADGTIVFEPVKGFGRFGSRGKPYTIEEFGRELAQSWQKKNYNPDDPARIRLHPAFVSTAKTDLGTVVEQSTTELDIDTFAEHSTLKAPIPDLIEEDVGDELKTEIEQLRDEKEEADSQLNALERRLNSAKDIGAMTPEEWLESHKDFYKELRQVDRGRSTSRASENGTQTPPGGRDPTLERVEAELTADD